MSAVSVFCLPHAGGGAHHYANWADHFEKAIIWKPIDYAGHFSRAGEAPYPSFSAAADDMTNVVFHQAAGGPLALFGHSMGGALAYEVACRLEQRLRPGHLKFVAISSTPPPHERDTEAAHYYTLPDDEFIMHLVAVGGISEQVASQRALMEHFLPLIRQDYQLYDLYQPQSPIKLHCPLAVMWGDQENLEEKTMSGWSRYCRYDVITRSWPAGHFHWHHYLSELCAELSALARLASGKEGPESAQPEALVVGKRQ